VPLELVGPALEHHVAFPNRVNVEFIQILSPGRIKQRTWERGTGETLACGSGACAVAVASMLRGRVDRSVVVELRGGVLEIEWADKNSSVLMTGPAATVFTGEWPLEDD
jgi:diaminopimelate epimerase